AASLVTLVMHLLEGVPRRSSALLLAGLRVVISATLKYARHPGGLNEQDKSLVKDISRDPRTILRRYNLEPTLEPYVCCMACFALYPVTSCPVNCIQLQCSSSAPCGAPLTRIRTIRGKEFRFSMRDYLHQPLPQWLGRLVSREGVEDIMRMPDLAALLAERRTARDFCDGEILRTFLGPDGERLFVDVPPDETRLIFALAIDGFNPYQSKTAKQKNMYLVGIIPGPSKPSMEQINHFLRLVVDDLLVLWAPGIRFSRTWKYRFGRLFRAALIPVVCDILAARQVVGLGSHSSTFFCGLCYLRLDDIENFDCATWPARDPDLHRRHAEEWKAAASLEDRDRLFDLHGIRWSELLRLPYWDPVGFTVVDSMHNLYLGLLKNHCRDIWGISVDLEDGDATSHPSKKTPQFPPAEDWSRGLRLLYHAPLSQLQKCKKAVLSRGANAKTMEQHNKQALVYMCTEAKLSSEGSRRDLAARLMSLRTQPQSVCTNVQKPEARTRNALGRQAMASFRTVRASMELPSWVTPAPRGFGTTEHGKLSADQWHTTCTAVLPVALVLVWGSDTQAETRNFKMLCNFMDLVSAVILAGLLEITSEHITMYEQYMLRYLTTMKDLYKEATVKPNHHYALHIPHFMRLFAPVHSWRSFAIERFNYVLQRMNTNLTHTGEMEATFMSTSCRAANLRSLLHNADILPYIEEFVSSYDTISGEDVRGMRLDAVLRGADKAAAMTPDEAEMKQSHLDEDYYDALLVKLNEEAGREMYVRHATEPGRSAVYRLSRAVSHKRKLLCSGIYYHTSRSSSRDSNILFNPSGPSTTPCAGSIIDIFHHTRNTTTDNRVSESFLVISHYNELSELDSTQDTFRRFPIAGGRLVYRSLAPGYSLIRPEQILCHVAKTAIEFPSISQPCFHVLPLDRVCERLALWDYH
ncbi:uncharacterized protein TRAVEDRAFT_132588, partial [Trametes versicolor FP-101664 SS1]|uniref:uncharacterized protein n=1 Tax=Trametes versicolor (strain FP-101664) TaxID=717944 RepID=UPI0004624611